MTPNQTILTSQKPRTGNWLQTFSGISFYPLDPQPEDINIADIAHGLAMTCRFAGQCQKFYSVAQHSVLVSQVCKPEDALWGLLHDASEAYLVDMPKPLKILPEFKWFVEVENRVQLAVSKHFGISEVQPESVHSADRALLMTEKRDLMLNVELRPWQIKFDEEPLLFVIEPLGPEEAKALFLSRFKELT